jgi:hypothetical protein
VATADSLDADVVGADRAPFERLGARTSASGEYEKTEREIANCEL